MHAHASPSAACYFSASRQSRNRPEPTTIAAPTSRLTVGTSPQIMNPSIIAQISEKYWNGDTTDVGARWIAFVHPYCARPLPIPFNASQPASVHVGTTKPNGNISENVADITTI